MSIVQTLTLYYQDNNSDKVYIANLMQDANGQYQVICHYGRRGSSLSQAIKTPKPVDFQTAQKAFNKTVNEKRNKGYSEGADANGVISNPNQDNLSGLMPQLLNSIDANEVLGLINDDRYMAQEKFDGERRMSRKVLSQITGSNKRGLVTNLATTIHNSLLALQSNNIELDGEAIGDHYYVFDILQDDTGDIAAHHADKRYQALKNTVPDSEYIHVVYTAFTSSEKLALYNKIMDEGGEGIVFKIKSSPYKEGRPNSGGSQFKYKFVETCSCIVTAFHSSKRSVAISLFKNGTLTDVGNVTIPPNKEMPNQDSIVEVRYLYAYEEGSLIQPVYLGERNDIVASECDVSHLKYKQELKAA